MKTYSNFINEYAEKYKKQMYGHGIIDFIQENVSTEDVKETAKQIENTPGVYCFIDNCECIAYIGKSSNLSSRIPSSFAEKRKYIKIKKIGYYPLDNVADMSVMEMLLIAENSPYLNRDGNNGKPSLFNSNIDIMKDFRFMALK